MVKVDKGSWDKSQRADENHNFNRECLARCQRVLKPNGTIWVTGTHHVIFSIGFAMQQLGFKILNDIAWEKPNPPPNLSCRYFTHSTETILRAANNEKPCHTFSYQEETSEKPALSRRSLSYFPRKIRADPRGLLRTPSGRWPRRAAMKKPSANTRHQSLWHWSKAACGGGVHRPGGKARGAAQGRICHLSSGNAGKNIAAGFTGGCPASSPSSPSGRVWRRGRPRPRRDGCCSPTASSWLGSMRRCSSSGICGLALRLEARFWRAAPRSWPNWQPYLRPWLVRGQTEFFFTVPPDGPARFFHGWQR